MHRARFGVATLALALALTSVSTGSAGAAGASGRTDRDSTGRQDATGAGTTGQAGGGLVAFVVPQGWKVLERASKVPPGAYLRLEDRWSLDEEEPVHELATVTNGSVTVALGAEPLYEAVDEPTWRRALLDLLGRRGAQFNIHAPATWAGEPSSRTIGELEGTYLRVDQAQIDTQLLVAVTRADAVPTASEQQDIDAFLDSVEVDDSVFGPLQNGIDARIHAGAAETGAGDFTASTLVPVDWIHDTAAEVGQLYVDPQAENAFVQFTLTRDELGLGAEIRRELKDFAAENFFGERTRRQKITRDGVPLVVVWDGNPKKTNAAAVYGTDGVIFLSLYIVTDDDNRLLRAMVDEFVLIDHNR